MCTIILYDFLFLKSQNKGKILCIGLQKEGAPYFVRFSDSENTKYGAPTVDPLNFYEVEKLVFREIEKICYSKTLVVSNDKGLTPLTPVKFSGMLLIMNIILERS